VFSGLDGLVSIQPLICGYNGCVTASQTSTGERLKNLGRFFIVALVISFWFAVLLLQNPGDDLETDFYPIYRAGQVLLAGENPYSQAEIEHYRSVWEAPFARAGFAYPLFLVVGIIPLLLLPLKAAAWVWTGFGIAGSAAAIFLQKNWRAVLLLPFLFMPLHRAATFRQATLVWCALLVVLILAMQHKKAWLVGWCIVMLAAKPQVGILFSAAGLVWGLRQDRKVLLWAGAWAVGIYGLSFWLQPGWVQAWMQNVLIYERIVEPVSLLPWSLILLAVTWKLPWYARLAAAQVALFPLSDVYSSLPLLLTWVGIGGWLSLAGSAVSWVWLALGLPTTVSMLWLMILLPVITASLVRFWQAMARPGASPAQR
jgi:hypothetical protein